jgi:hypothetical protein
MRKNSGSAAPSPFTVNGMQPGSTPQQMHQQQQQQMQMAQAQAQQNDSQVRPLLFVHGIS